MKNQKKQLIAVDLRLQQQKIFKSTSKTKKLKKEKHSYDQHLPAG